MQSFFVGVTTAFLLLTSVSLAQAQSDSVKSAEPHTLAGLRS